MGNERITEDFVRDRFKNDPLISAIKLDEQKTPVSKGQKMFPRSKASKNLTGKSRWGGFVCPEFIVSCPPACRQTDIIVVECKADVIFHESEDGENPVSYAVDGLVLHSALAF